MELELSLNQKQTISQNMQLSLNILQMNALDLEQHIREAALENPMIELDLPQEAESPETTRLKKLEWLDRMDESNRYVLSPDNNERSDMPLCERGIGDSLYDTLIQQVSGFRLDPETEKAVRYIIGCLDENGYISTPKKQIMRELSINETVLQAALDTIHRMDPPGVGAEGLRECLLIQARRLECASPVLTGLIENHLDTLAKNQLGKLASSLRITVDEVKEARDQLLTLNPKPGNGYSSYKAIPYIRPDLFIVRFENRFEVIFNDYGQPRIEISGYYKEIAKDSGTEAADYIQDKLRKAEWLISCIRQRKSTVLKCAGSILGRQRCFFENGPGNLAPMTLSDVANDIGVHPSTVGRAVRGKYLQCQWGVFGLGDLFTRNVGSCENEEQSQDMVLAHIRLIISEENPSNPLSDQKLSECLKSRGFNVARRTVAKYREQLGIPTASNRKKF